MQIEQFVMAYGVEQDRLRAILPEGFTSLRPVLRINGEIRDGAEGYLEFNTAVEKDGVRGWLNIGRTLPALPIEVKTVYPRQTCTVEHAAVIPYDQVLGTYKVTFDRVSSLK